MKKYYDDSKIKHIKNKDITIEIKPYRKIINGGEVLWKVKKL